MPFRLRTNNSSSNLVIPFNSSTAGFDILTCFFDTSRILCWEQPRLGPTFEEKKA